MWMCADIVCLQETKLARAEADRDLTLEDGLVRPLDFLRCRFSVVTCTHMQQCSMV